MKTKTYLLSIILVIALVVFFLYVFRAPISAELNTLKLVPQAEPFTELYINDFQALQARLPSSIHPGDTVSFSFTIHNLEGRAVSYPYDVYVISTNGYGSATTTVDSNEVYLPNTASTTIRESYTFASSNTQTSFVIVLPTLNNQSIHFFVPNK